ncbi:peptide-methionine (R)-S-oxide reductase MsrB [Sphingomonas daechungensis]|uniref:peptide-methionine (R)-S-oxide reductase MsrB n=1 Tax=Sphingomonas daechungensis TaxID=1176646 RepID=UPI00378332D0
MTNETSSRRSFLALGAGCLATALIFSRTGKASAEPQFEIRKAPAQWRQSLGDQRYHILREAGTERPYSSPLNSEHRRGIFSCAGCALQLFSSSTKFDSGTGWPSFYRPLPKAVVTREDNSLLMHRTEVLCRRCGGHLGHVFDDGPKPTGLRYCMNGLALTFRAA